MPLKIEGEMVQAKDFEKLKEFMVLYDKKTEEGRAKTGTMLDLLNQIR
jgi:hypothetical protein